jgi:hypothetical protein
MILNLFFLLFTIDAKIIKNIDIPTCRNCVHYKPNFLSGYSSDLGKCEYFGTKNIQTGIITTDYVSSCRENEEKCGLEGKYFEEEVNVELKIFLHNIIKTIPYSLLFLIFFMNVYIQVLEKNSS